MNGFINILKPVGISSAAVVSKVKRKLNQPSGHMGTLDPLASGVLPIGVNKASRLFNYLLSKDKVYEAEFTFGYQTDTLDSGGVIEKETSVIPTEKQILSVIGDFIGEIDQVPPKYCANNINGKRGYALARSGVDFELKAKRITINDISVLSYQENKLNLRIDCKGGTYIRSLARDVANRVGSLATMTALRRTKSGVFTEENGVDLEEFINSPTPLNYMLPPHIAVSFPRLDLNARQGTRLLNGLRDEYSFDEGFCVVFVENDFWGVGEIENGLLKMKSFVR